MKTKNTNKTKQGISLIVLVITIIVMIILAAAVILSLSSNGVIDRANEAVDKTNLAGVKTIATTIWAEQYLKYRDGDITKHEINDEVIKGLIENKIDITKYDIKADEKGVDVTLYNVIEGCPIYFGRPYSTRQDGSLISYIVYTDGSAEIYENMTLQQSMPTGTLSYDVTNISMGGETVAVVSEDGKTFTAYGINYTLDTIWCPHSKIGANDGIDVYLGAYCRVCGKALELNHNNIIPEGGTYYVGVTGGQKCVYTGYTSKYVGIAHENSMGIESNIKFGEAYVTSDGSGMVVFHIDGSAEFYQNGEYFSGMPSGTLTYSGESVYSSNQLFVTVSEDGNQIDATATFGVIINYDESARVKFPKNVSDGDVYVYGDYEYRYNEFVAFLWIDKATAQEVISGEFSDGWGVVVLDMNKTEYEPVLESVNGEMVSALWMTFMQCENMTKAPAIPKGVNSMVETFNQCIKLEDATKMPNGVKYLINTFAECETLQVAPVIPNSVVDMTYTFYNCKSLKGTIVINANPTKYDVCLYGTGIASVEGETTMADELLATVNKQ